MKLLRSVVVAGVCLSSFAQAEIVVEVAAKKRMIPNTTPVSQTEINQTQVQQLPQGGEVSLPKLISSTTPGVVPGPFGQLFIRGNHASIQYQIDGIQMPESPSTTFGQAFSPRNIDHMEVITGGIPAEFGQRLSAVVNIVTKTGPEQPGGEIELNYGSYNTISPHVLYGGSNEAGNFHYYFGLNYGQTDRGLDSPNPESVNNQFQGGTESVHNKANNNSEFAKFDWQFSNSDKLSVVLFHAYNVYQIPYYPGSFNTSLNTAAGGYFGTSYTDQFGNQGDVHEGHQHTLYVYSPADNTQVERNAYLQVAWKHTFDSHSSFLLAPYYKYSSIINTNDPFNDFYSVDTLAIDGASPSSFSQNRHANTLGIKGDYTNRLSEAHLLKAGFQLQTAQVAGTFSVQTDLSQAPTSNSDPMTGTFESLYVQDEYAIHRGLGKISDDLTLNAGIRFDATQFGFSGVSPTDYQFQPRIGLSYLPVETTKFHLFYGRLFQPAPIENLRSTFSVVNTENPSVVPYDIKAEKDDFFEIGVAQQVFEQHVVGLNVFYKTGINILDDAQLLRTPISQPFNFAEGYSYGAELSLKGQITPEWSHYLNYSYLIARARGISGGIWASDHPLSTYFQNMDHSQAHTGNAGLTYSRKGFWWTTQALYGSGLWTGDNNSISLPGHLTFDTTVGYAFEAKEGWLAKWRVSGDILNITDNRYPITIANSFNGSHYAAGRMFFIRLTKLF